MPPPFTDEQIASTVAVTRKKIYLIGHLLKAAKELLKAAKRAAAMGDIALANALMAQAAQILGQAKTLRDEVSDLLGTLASQLEANEIWRSSNRPNGNDGQPPVRGGGNRLFKNQIDSIDNRYRILMSEVKRLS